MAWPEGNESNPPCKNNGFKFSNTIKGLGATIKAFIIFASIQAENPKVRTKKVSLILFLFVKMVVEDQTFHHYE